MHLLATPRRPIWSHRFSPALTGVVLLLAALATASAQQASGGLSIDPKQREQARVFYNAVYQASDAVPSGWTGSVANGLAGTTTSAFQDATALRVNYFRAMAGVSAAITFSDALSAEAQQAALMMSANNALSHFPPATWLDYTAQGAQAASASDLTLGQEGPEAVSGYIEDPGGNNAAAGHRRWVLYPPTTVMGTGDVDGDATHEAANALWIIQPEVYGTAAPVRDEFVAWPPPGFVPYPVVYPRWSFSYPGADFSAAAVAMQRGGQAVPVRQETVANSAGDNTLVWVPDNLSTDGTGTPVGAAVSADTAYAVTVANVLVGGVARTFTYNVTVFDPAQPGADTVRPTLTSPAAGTYQFNAVPGATGYRWTARTATPFVTKFDAENGVGDATVLPRGATPVVSTDGQDGAACYQLNSSSETGAPGSSVGADTTGEILTLNASLLPAAGSTLRFASRLGLHADDEQALVQVSTDDGQHWSTVYQQTGASDPETAFSTRSVDLSAYAGLPSRVRFAFVAPNVGSYYPRNPITGWFVDDIAFSGTRSLGAATTGNVPDGALGFSWTAPDAAAYVLQVTPLFFGGYAADAGPLLLAGTSTGGGGGGQSSATTVAVLADVPAVTAGTGDAGEFTVTRTGDLSQTITVLYTVKGSAAGGVDYIPLKGQVKLKAGKASKAVKVVPLGVAGDGTSKRQVKLTLQAGDGYTVGEGAGTAKVKIVR